ncbi:hypothetical protein [Candidatus Xianfuyuplasma coldseepsis]|uniref:Uncharacterized protein n=1 Tax=Candidatus Xianfuyuplasma coldseepsis TaxID=2782163 RepID=A0A7L7KTJ8_9MOLU|nr:hypothetical protein [Xianfuyuplasma coldseepsis]QMS85098.1 hypothetical protein G4Z02_04855 [Xianfuyuplasma coldseepsis]
MTFKNQYRLEIEGIIETINEYAIEHFIRSYTKQLRQLQLPNDLEMIQVIIDRLVHWYQEHIDDIEQSRFIANKKEHHISYELLIEFQEKLKSYVG